MSNLADHLSPKTRASLDNFHELEMAWPTVQRIIRLAGAPINDGLKSQLSPKGTDEPIGTALECASMFAAVIEGLPPAKQKTLSQIVKGCAIREVRFCNPDDAEHQSMVDAVVLRIWRLHLDR